MPPPVPPVHAQLHAAQDEGADAAADHGSEDTEEHPRLIGLDGAPVIIHGVIGPAAQRTEIS
eukprot:CAMPEP_0118983622 /NCGR_PEP_ID=MMETSP1173-20130426/35888_1 /TAXON_ID=1034831 /ORGANISM="Rhizochromulina marina cf, Strain CCMP1243" /LENGTH=61 /DNA_ID=CAMNT_0006934217 /DNA_START=45 /DNA_END=227 /DNA_ORIENTATION=-